jgi:hypothetical protein
LTKASRCEKIILRGISSKVRLVDELLKKRKARYASNCITGLIVLDNPELRIYESLFSVFVEQVKFFHIESQLNLFFDR